MGEMNLKTLKDFGAEGILVNVSDIREEAIKWVIDGAKKGKNGFKMFMEFFNITESELK